MPVTAGSPPGRVNWAERPYLRFAPQLGLLLVVLCGMAGTGAYLSARVIDVLPDVGKDLHPVESWVAPIAVEHKHNGWVVAHVPACARSAVAGLVLWDDADRPLWELRGESYPIAGFVVGATLPGLKVVHKYAQPNADQVLRVAMFRSGGGPAGVTFRVRDLRDGAVRYGGKWVSVTSFMTSATCPKPKVAKPPASASKRTSTSVSTSAGGP